MSRGPGHKTEWGVGKRAVTVADRMSIRDKSTYGPCGTRGRSYKRAGLPKRVPRPEEKEREALEEMSPGAYLPLWQLMAMGIQEEPATIQADPMPSKIDRSSNAATSMVPTLPSIGEGRSTGAVGAAGARTGGLGGKTTGKTAYDHGHFTNVAGQAAMSIRSARQRRQDRLRLGISGTLLRPSKLEPGRVRAD